MLFQTAENPARLVGSQPRVVRTTAYRGAARRTTLGWSVKRFQCCFLDRLSRIPFLVMRCMDTNGTGRERRALRDFLPRLPPDKIPRMSDDQRPFNLLRAVVALILAVATVLAALAVFQIQS